MAGGCYGGPEGAACWGDWWLGLVFLAVLGSVAFLIIGAAVVIVRNPGGFFGYYRSKRSLVIIPLTFIGLAAVFIAGSFLIYQYHLPFWAQALLWALLLSILLAGDWTFRRWNRRS